MGQSISFDRAASFYDKTRRLPDDLAQKITAAILGEIRKVGADRMLEVGIGTGRMARPLMAEGVRVTGVDISAQMMAQLRAQLGPEHVPPDLLLGDATRLPFRDNSFRTAIVVHVFHLVSSAADAIAEIRRVLAPGGVLLHQKDRPDAPTQRGFEEHLAFWDGLSCELGFERRHQVRFEELEDLFRRSGATLDYIELMPREEAQSIEDELAKFRARTNSWSWDVPEKLTDVCLPRYEAFLREKFPDGRMVDRSTYVIETVRWRA